MKKLIVFLLLFSSAANAGCDWTKIAPGPNHTWIYPDDLHLCVGQLVQANKDLTAAIQLKDLAIKYSDDRTALWQKSATDEMTRLNTIEADQKHSDWLFFGLGVATVFLSGYAAAKLAHP